MPGPADLLSRTVVQRTMELHRRRVWETVGSDSPFLITYPGELHPLGAVLLGESEGEPGLMLLRGPAAFPCLLRLNALDDRDGFVERGDLVSATVTPLADVPAPFRVVLQHAGHHARRDSLVPSLAVRRPGAAWRAPKRSELELMAWALGAVLAAHESGTLRSFPADARDRRVLLLEATGALRAPDVVTRLVPWPAGANTPDVIAALTDAPLPSGRDEDSLDPDEIIRDEFAATVAAVFSHPPAPHTLPPQTSDSPAAALAGWKHAERQLIEFLMLDLDADAVANSRAVKRYFEHPELAAMVLLELSHWSPMQAYLDWLLCDYRPTHRSATRVEKLLRRKSLPDDQRALLEALRDSEVSLYRVEGVDPGATIEVQDVLSGRRHTLHDKLLSESLPPGLVLPLRLLRLVRFTLPHVAGPPLMPLQVDRALLILENPGADLESPEALRAQAQLLGRLWLDALGEPEAAPQLQNTDGEALRWHTASFHVDDPALLQRLLAARDDVEWDTRRLEGVWLRPGPPAPGFGENTVLAHLELLGDRLVAELNSAPRLQRARAWIESLPGVHFEHATERDDGPGARPLDDRLPAAGSGDEPALSGPLLDEIKRMHKSACLAWLDEQVPALGGLTPREACATTDGRGQVARMIRTMPPATMPGGTLEPPRDELLRELGLAGD